MNELVDPVLFLVAVSARTALHPPVLSYPMRTRFWETTPCKAVISGNPMDDLSELLDDLPGPGDVLDTLDGGSLDELLDVLDTGEGKTRSQDSSPIPQTDE